MFLGFHYVVLIVYQQFYQRWITFFLKDIFYWIFMFFFMFTGPAGARTPTHSQPPHTLARRVEVQDEGRAEPPVRNLGDGGRWRSRSGLSCPNPDPGAQCLSRNANDGCAPAVARRVVQGHGDEAAAVLKERRVLEDRRQQHCW